jgi:hypothetical protein
MENSCAPSVGHAPDVSLPSGPSRIQVLFPSPSGANAKLSCPINGNCCPVLVSPPKPTKVSKPSPHRSHVGIGKEKLTPIRPTTATKQRNRIPRLPSPIKIKTTLSLRIVSIHLPHYPWYVTTHQSANHNPRRDPPLLIMPSPRNNIPLLIRSPAAVHQRHGD